MNQYKYISKPYTLDELVNGSPLFKIYCDFFNEVYEWEQEQNFTVDSNYVSIEHLELLFNEFLNILSLLLYDKASYNNTFNHITLKIEEIKNLSILMYNVPKILENCNTIYDSEMTEKVRKFIKRKDELRGININEYKLKFYKGHGLYKIAYKVSGNLLDFGTAENIIDLTNFFDLRNENLVLAFQKSIHLRQKRFDNNILYAEKTNSKTKIGTTDKKIKADIIFKKEYINLFHHIVESYSDKQNKAFFSYLYHYFSENKLLLKNLKSSLNYNRFLVQNDFIDEFSKVIQRTTENSEEEKRIFVIFKEAYDEFFQIDLKEI